VNKAHEKQESRYWAHGVIADLINEYLSEEIVKELIPVFGNDAFGKMRYRAVREELMHFLDWHDKRRSVRPRVQKATPKRAYRGKKTGSVIKMGDLGARRAGRRAG
jgi:hypothetical protein